MLSLSDRRLARAAADLVRSAPNTWWALQIQSHVASQTDITSEKAADAYREISAPPRKAIATSSAGIVSGNLIIVRPGPSFKIEKDFDVTSTAGHPLFPEHVLPSDQGFVTVVPQAKIGSIEISKWNY
jgi:hypothetical protein